MLTSRDFTTQSVSILWDKMKHCDVHPSESRLLKKLLLLIEKLLAQKIRNISNIH